VILTRFYINSEDVIPTPYQERGGNPAQKYWIPGQARNDK